jgi:hypothetical protein
MAGQSGELATGIVRLWLPLSDGTQPELTLSRKGQESVDEGVARLGAKLSDNRRDRQKPGMLLDVQEEPKISGSKITFNGGERLGNCDEMWLCEVRVRQFAVTNAPQNGLRLTGFSLLVGESSPELMLQGKVPLFAALAPVLFDPNAESVLAAPLHVFLD